jgi:putative membrane protein
MAMTSLATLPGFLLYFILGIALLAVAMTVTMRVTPHDELALIRAGNAPAAIALGGSIIGFALPIASAFSHSVNILDALVWSVVAMLVQLGVFFAMAQLLGGGWRAAMERGETAGAILKAAVAIAVGLLNAACLST